MAEDLLVENRIEAGRQITHRLWKLWEAPPYAFSGSFWLHDSDTNSWRLWIVCNLLYTHGPRPGYIALGEALAGLVGQNVSLRDLLLVTPRVRAVRVLQKALRIPYAQNLSEGRLQNVSIEGVLFDDAYIYFLDTKDRAETRVEVDSERLVSPSKIAVIDTFLRKTFGEPEYAWIFDRDIHSFRVDDVKPRVYLRMSMEFVADHTEEEIEEFFEVNCIADRLREAATQGNALVILNRGIQTEPIRPQQTK